MMIKHKTMFNDTQDMCIYIYCLIDCDAVERRMSFLAHKRRQNHSSERNPIAHWTALHKYIVHTYIHIHNTPIQWFYLIRFNVRWMKIFGDTIFSKTWCGTSWQWWRQLAYLMEWYFLIFGWLSVQWENFTSFQSNLRFKLFKETVDSFAFFLWCRDFSFLSFCRERETRKEKNAVYAIQKTIKYLFNSWTQYW